MIRNNKVLNLFTDNIKGEHENHESVSLVNPKSDDPVNNKCINRIKRGANNIW